ncbi:MAG: Spy/CpxP family protein refolding chaperone [Prolixibacteraceae bacterium]|nr:Spy/CpxP family protein refolding chaperone [Prolixibacteraceae bacterium]
MKRRVLGITIVAVVLITTSAFAQRTEQGRTLGNRGEIQFQRNGDMNQRAERMQFFTDEQQEAIKNIRLETAKEIKPLRNQLNELEARQKTLTTADKADMKAINNNIEEMGKVKTEIAKIQAKQQQDIRSLLTEEQLLRFDNSGERSFGNRSSRPEIGRSAMNRGQMPGRFNRNRF